MDAIYANSGEKFLKKVKLYPGENEVLCLDEDGTEPISKAGLINLFEKGEILIVETVEDVTVEYVPALLGLEGNAADVVVITVASGEVETITAVPKVFHSESED